MLDSGFAAFLNHLLRHETWARERLCAFAGKTAHFNLPPFGLRLAVLDNGEVAVAAPEVPADATLLIPPSLLLARDEAALRQIEVSGDAAFAEEIAYLFKHLRWDVEEDLSRAFGDIAAHRMAQAGRSLAAWPPQAAENIARAFAEYWTEEQPLLAKAAQVAQFASEVDRLRDDVERLGKRIERMIQRTEGDER